MTAHFNPLKDTAYELYFDSIDVAAGEDNGSEERAKDRRLTEKYKPTMGRVKNDPRRFALAILMDDLRSTFAHTAHYAASSVFGPSPYSSFSLIKNDKNNPLTDKSKKIFRKEGIFQRIYDLTSITIRYNPSDPSDPLIKKIMNLFCPGFKLGDTWETDPNNRYGRKNIPISGTTTHYVTLKDLLSVVGKPVDDGSSRPAPEPPFAFFNPKYWGPRVRFKFTTDASTTLYTSRDVTSGPVQPSFNSPVLITIHPSIEVDFEAEAMAWCLSATDPADITIYDALRHIEPFENMVFKNGGKGMSECTERTTALGATMKTVDRINRRIGNSQPRINEEGFAINPDGSVLHLDYKPDVDTFFEGLKESYNSETGELLLQPKVANKPLILDWSAGVFVWTNANLNSINNTTIKDISETRALKDEDIGQMLNAPLGGLFKNALKDALRLSSGVPGASNISYGIKADTILSEYQSKEVGLTAANLFTDVYVDKYGNENESVTRLFHRIGQLFRLVAEHYDAGKDAIATRITHRFPIFLFGRYADPQYSKRYLDADKAVTAKYRKRTEDDVRYATPVTYNMPGVTHFMPHQQEVINDAAARDTANTLLGIKAGGGKTVTYTTMIMNDKEAGSVKLPLVVMPKPLLRQFQNEVMNFYSQGAIRIFPIYLAIWKRWESIGLSYQDIEAIIRQQPANTIFLTDYNFLKYQPENISLGIDGFSSYPVSRWLSRIFDMIVADESHKVKNAGIKGVASAVSRAYGALVTYAQKQVLASGTIVHNTSLDALGQIMKTSPTTFNGDISEYTDSSGKLLKSSKLEEFTQEIAKRNSFYNVSDKRWAFLLPKINEIQHAVNMTPNQQRFYNEKLKELVLMLEESEEFKAAKKKDAETGDTSQQEFLLNQELSGFEIFLGAPDANERSLAGRDPFGAEFRTLSTTKPSDLISPKVAKVDEIIEAHFNGGRVGDSDIEYVKSKAKIIIFAYNVAIPKHIMQHSRFKNIMLHYEADGEKGLETVEKFKNDDRYKVLVAGEKTLSEGHNLQVASRIIRLQTIWTPGDFDQTLRRVLRPDVPDANGKLKYNRKTIDLDWIICEPSFEAAKTARLFTKFLDKAKFEEYDNNPRFRDWLKKNPYEDLSLFTMNLESIVGLQTFDSLSEYQAMYANLKSFEDSEYDIEKRNIWKKTILRLKLADKAEIDRISQMPPDAQNDELEKILSSDDLRAKAMVQVEKRTLTGFTPSDRADFTRGYTPIVAGATIVDPYKLGLIPVASIVENNRDDAELDEDEGDEDEDAEFNTQVEEGEYVITEFGIGVAGRQRMGRGGEGFSPNIPVTIDGIGKINLPATVVFVPQERAQKDRLAGIFKHLVKNRRPTSVLTIDNNSVTVNDITVASSDIPAGKASVKTISTDRIRDAVEDKISRTPTQPVLTPAPFTGVKPMPGTRRPMPPPMQRPAPVVPPVSRPPVTTVSEPVVKPMPGAKPKVDIQPPSKPQPVPESRAPKPMPVKTTMSPKPPIVTPPAPNVKPMPGATVKPTPAAPVAAPKPVVKLTPAQKKDLTQPFEIATLNNQLTVIADADNDTFDKALMDHGFTRIGNSVMAQIINLQGFININKYLNDTFYIPDEYQAGMNRAIEALKKGKSSVSKLIPSLKEQRQFILLNEKRKVSDINNEIHPIILVDDNIIYLLINVERLRAGKKLTNRMVVKGVSKFTPREPMFLKFYPSVSSLIKDMTDLEKNRGVTISNEDALAQELAKI